MERSLNVFYALLLAAWSCVFLSVGAFERGNIGGGVALTIFGLSLVWLVAQAMRNNSILALKDGLQESNVKSGVDPEDKKYGAR